MNVQKPVSANEHLTPEQMQCLALEIEKLLDAAMATSAEQNPHDHFSLIDMAQDRASRLKVALDPVNFRNGK